MASRSDAERSTYQALVQRLLGGEPSLTTFEVAERTGLSAEVVRGFWRSAGFADVADEVPHFTESDVALLVQVAELVRDGDLGLNAAQTMVRAHNHSADRLALWLIEALVDDAAARYELDDTSARIMVLDRVADLIDVLEAQLVHTWRRQLVALLGRIERDVARAHMPSLPDTDQLPLERSVGFLDMISYTERTVGMSSAELAELVLGFETVARDTIAAQGARVVKTIGDAVLYVADDLRTGAEVALRLLEEMDRRDFDVRGSLVWGRVLSRSGDIFGPSVNLASRLSDVAPPGGVVMDDVSAALLDRTDRDLRLQPLPPVAVHGLGEVRPVQLTRAARA